MPLKWKQNKTYVYYIPEHDWLYTATYMPEHTKNFHGEPYTTEKDFGAGPVLINFYPDVVVIITKEQAYKKLETVYIGEL